MDNKNKKSSQEQNLLFKKYYILSKIDEGSFGSIYLAQNIITKEKVAIKVENRKQYKPLLEREAYILFYLRGPGLPKIITFGKTRDYFILIQTLLGPSLSSLLEDFSINFTIKDICMLSIQMLERLEYIHSKDYIHRDIKPHNFLMGLKDPNMLYIIDFGLSKKYRSKKGKHIKFAITNNITGTPRYCSINALRGAEQSRKDDLESLFYVIIYFFRGDVPWQNLKIKSRNERFKKINEIKKKVNYKILCKNLPEEVYNFGIYVKNLKFEEQPNYTYMQKLFYTILSKINQQNDDKFSWIKINTFQSSNSTFSHKNIFKEKPSSHKRLYEKISNSLEKKLIKKKNNIIFIQTQTNSIKDNITLVSLNIENQMNNINNNNNYTKIKKATSYGGLSDVRVLNLMKKNEKFNLSKEDIMKNKINNIHQKNFDFNQKIKRNTTTTKMVRKNNVLKEDYNTNNDTSFNTNNNDSIKNIFLRNNKILYESPYILLNKKKNEKIKNNNLNNNNNSLIKKEYYYKYINKNNKINKSNNNILNSERQIAHNRKINSSNVISTNSNVQNIKHKSNFSNDNIILKKNKVSYNSNNNYINTYNGVNIKLNLGKANGIYRTNSTNSFPVSNKLGKKNYINFVNDSLINKKKNISMKNKRNINLNIKLINNNNYNNVPLMIYNDQSNKLNNIKYYLNQKSPNIINKNKKLNNINNCPNNTKPINSNRVTKYTLQRKTITSVYNNNYNSKSTFPIDDENLNKIKIMNIPKHKNNLNKKLSLYH